MLKKTTEYSVASRWFYLFLLTHYLVWTCAPIMVRYNLPLDAIEGTIWAHQLEWSYDKNPFLNGWLTALAIKLDGNSGWLIYHFCQLSVVACLWSVWQISRRILTPYYALISVMVLEGVQYYNLHALDFNDNTLELGLWGVTMACFYWVIGSTRFLCTENCLGIPLLLPWSCEGRRGRMDGKEREYRDVRSRIRPRQQQRYLPHSRTQKTCTGHIIGWLLTGFFAALALMAKYYTLTLLASMFLFLIMTPTGRQQLKTWPPYLALIIFAAVITPHIFWLFSHDFTTVRYVFMRASSKPDWTNHLFFPAQFAWQMLQAFLPALALFLFLLIGKKPVLAVPRQTISTTHKAFLFYVGLGPFLLTVLLSLITGIKLRAGWGMPLLSLWGIILVATVQPAITKAKLHRFIALVFLVIALLAAGYTKSLVDSDTPSSANFPGRDIAALITKQWHDKYHRPLEYVAGSRWAAGNVAFYSCDDPAVFIEWDEKVAPWINLKELEKKGAVFVWCISDDESMPKSVAQRFPQLQPTQVLEFEWLRNTHDLKPIKIGVAFLPPKGKL